LYLRLTAVLLAKQELSVEIAHFNGVHIDDVELSERELRHHLQHLTSDAAHADHDDSQLAQPVEAAMDQVERYGLLRLIHQF
jgi:hypothetical protein